MSRRDFFEEEKMSKIVKIFGIVLVISIIAFVIIFTIYNRKLKEEANLSVLDLGAINTIVPNDNTVSASFSEDKGKENNIVENALANTVNDKVEENTTSTEKSKKTNTSSQNTAKVSSTNTVNNTANNIAQTTDKENTVVNNSTENTVTNTTENTDSGDKVENNLSFMAPVAGEISKDFANDTLIYSNTLEEWTTHLGIDIKAERTSIVVASEAGKIESIKTDPRYGLTITIDHGNGYKTIYSNLLTTEFVQIGETVEKGQTIATVGDTASFEILDEPHLHFEMYINGEAVNPTLYFK